MNLTGMLSLLLPPLLLTVLLEEGALLLLWKFPLKRRLTGISGKGLFFLCLAGNLLTNPTVNLLLLLGRSVGLPYVGVLIPAELGAVLFEALLYWLGSREQGASLRRKVLLLSLGLNAFSWLSGMVIYSFV